MSWWMHKDLLMGFFAVVQRRRGSRSEPISEDDLVRAISKLKVLGGGWAVTKVRLDRIAVPWDLTMQSSELSWWCLHGCNELCLDLVLM